VKVMMSRLVVETSDEPMETSSSTDIDLSTEQTSEEKSEVQTGSDNTGPYYLIAGVVVAGIVVSIGSATAVIFFVLRSKRKRDTPTSVPLV